MVSTKPKNRNLIKYDIHRENSHTLALQREISNALSFATSKGYQVHPDAFAMLKGLDTDILKLIQKIIKMKLKHKENSLIVVDDIKNIISPNEKFNNIDV